MAVFIYEAMNRSGQQVKAELEASSTDDALAKIRNLGLFPTRIREKGGRKKTRSRGSRQEEKGWRRASP